MQIPRQVFALKHPIRIVLCCFPVLIGAASASAPSGPRAVTLTEALKLAESRQPDLAAAKARFAVAEADTRVAHARWATTVGVLGEFLAASTNNSTATFVSNSAVDIARVGATATSPPVNWSGAMSSLAAIGLRQQVWDFGRTFAQTAAAEYSASIHQSRIDATRTEVRFAITQAFYSVLASRAVLTAAHGAYDRARVLSEYVGASVSRGMRAPVDRARAEADLARAEAAAFRAEGGLRYARTVLAASIGVDDAEIDASGSVETDSVASAATSSFDARWERVQERDPILKIARLRLDVQREEVVAARAQLFPTLFVSASLSARAGGAPTNTGQLDPWRGALPSVPNYHMGLVLSWNALDYVAITRLWSTKEQEAVVLAEQQATVLRQRSILHQAMNDLEIAEKTLAAQKKAATAARSNFAQAEQRYRSGLASLLERTDAEALLTDAEIQLVVSEFQVARAKLQLKRASAEEL